MTESGNRDVWLASHAEPRVPDLHLPAEDVAKPLAREKVKAAKNVVMLDLAVLNADAAPACVRSPSKHAQENSVTIRCRLTFAPSSLRRGRAGGCCRRRLLSDSSPSKAAGRAPRLSPFGFL